MKKLISLITSGMLAVIPAVQVQLYACADEFSVLSVSEKVTSLTDTSITEAINPNKQESENQPVTTDITGNSDIYEPIVTTQAPPSDNEIRAVIEYDPNKIVNLNIGEELDLNSINLGISVWGFESNNDFFEISSEVLNYKFSIGSGKHSNCYTYDTSDIDTSTAGLYTIKVNPLPNVSEKFVFENSSSSKIPNGEYEFTIQDRPFYIMVEVIDHSATATTEPNFTDITTTTSTTTKVYTTATEKTGTDINTTTITSDKIIIKDYAIKLEYDDSPMKIGEKRAIHVYNPITGEPESITEFSFDSNITASCSPENDKLYITALESGEAKIYIFGTGCAFGSYAYLTVTDEQFYENISTSLNTATTTTTTAATTMSSNSQTSAPSTESDANTTVVVMDYRTQLEYDNSPMKIGEKRAIRLYNPATGTTSGAYISEASSNISVSYEPNSDTVYITALESGDITLYIRESSCAFGNYVNLTITEELLSENNNKTPLPEQLPQTGYSYIYKWILYFAVLITTSGTVITIYSKKKVK